MKAVLQEGYGPPEVLRIAEVERPEPAADEVLVRVVATTVTRGDAMRVSGREYRFVRLFSGLRRPREPRIGSEFAGVVEQVGPSVREFRPGDEVFGMATGANAEFLAVGEDRLIVAKPPGLTFAEAAALSDGALLALSCLPAEACAEGRRVLVYGAAGSIGSAAVQVLANHFGADISAVCDTRDVEVVRSLGARRVFDRLTEDFRKSGETYDVIFDAVGKTSFRRCRNSLRPRGRYVSMDLGFMYHLPLLALVTRLMGRRRASVGIGRYRRSDLALVKRLVEEGKFRAVIDRRHPLAEVAEAHRYVVRGEKRGSVVLDVDAAETGSASGD